MSSTAVLDAPFMRTCDLTRDPFATVFGTRRGLTARMRAFRANSALSNLSDYLGFAFMLGQHNLPYAELVGHPSFQPILSSPLFSLNDKDQQGAILRVHLGISTDGAPSAGVQFTVMVMERSGLTTDSNFWVFLQSYSTLGEALNHAAGYLNNRNSVHPPDPGDPPATDLTDFTAEEFKKAFSRRLAGS